MDYNLLPVRSLYKISITAITIKMWMILPKSGKAKYPINHPMISSTTISQIKSFILLVVLVQQMVAY